MGVENLVVTATAGSEITFANAAGTTVNISGVTSVTNLASAGALTLTNLTAIPVITLNNASAGTVVTFATDVLAGTADTVTLNLSGVNPAAAGAVSGGINLAGGAAGIETLVINSVAAASTIDAVNYIATSGSEDGKGIGNSSSSVKTLTVTGDADLTLVGSAFAKVTSFDGSTATGGITASFATFGSGTTNVQTIKTGAGKDSITLGQNGAQYTSIIVNTGAGNDTVTVGATLSTKHTLDGGAGTDTLAIDLGSAGQTLAAVSLVNARTSNFETMEFNGSNAMVSLDASAFTGFTGFVFDAADATATTTITSLTSAQKFTFNSDMAGAVATGVIGSSPVAATAALSLTASGTAQVANIVAADDDSTPKTVIVGGAGSVGAASANGVAATSAISFGGGITSLSITATSAVDIIGGAGGAGHITGTGVGGAAAAAIDNGTAVKTVTITGSGAVTIQGGAAGPEGATGTGSPAVKAAGGAVSTNGFTGAVTVDASTLKGVLTIQGSTGTDSITGGTANDVIRGGASNDTVVLTAGGADTVVLEATAAGNAVDTISGFTVGTGSGADVLNVNAFLGHANATVTGDVIKITNLSGSATIATETVIIVNFNAAIASKDFGSAAGFAELFGAAKALSTTLADAAEAVVVVQGTDGTQVYYVDNGTGTDTTLLATEVSLVANLVGVTNADTFDFSNFVI